MSILPPIVSSSSDKSSPIKSLFNTTNTTTTNNNNDTDTFIPPNSSPTIIPIENAETKLNPVVFKPTISEKNMPKWLLDMKKNLISSQINLGNITTNLNEFVSFFTEEDFHSWRELKSQKKTIKTCRSCIDYVLI